MSDQLPISYEELNAFLDGQLDEKESSRVLKAINSDHALLHRVSELRQLRDMMQHAYQQPPKPEVAVENNTVVNGVRQRVAVMAACLMLCLGSIFGWVAHQGLTKQADSYARVIYPAENIKTSSDRLLPMNSKNVILHLISSDPARLTAALDQAEAILSEYKANNLPLTLEVIANDGGLDLMRTDVSLYHERIKLISEKYDNVRFLACAKAIRRLQSNGIDVELLPEIQIAPSALEQIIFRMQDGWQYIKV